MSCGTVLSQGLSGLHDRTSERTHIHGSAVQKLDVEGLARRDGERVDVDGRALDRVVDVVERGNRPGAVTCRGRGEDDTGKYEERGEAEERRHCGDVLEERRCRLVRGPVEHGSSVVRQAGPYNRRAG